MTSRRSLKKDTKLEGKDLKFLVDMYHYRNGGYPNPESLPKNFELVKNFALFIKYMSFVGFEDLFKGYLQSFGLEVKILEEVKDFQVKEDLSFKSHLNQTILDCSDIQSEICSRSNQIKRDISQEISKETKVIKSHITKGVFSEYRKRKVEKKDNYFSTYMLDVKSQEFINKMILEDKNDDDILKYIQELKIERETKDKESRLESVEIGQEVGLKISGKILTGKVLEINEKTGIISVSHGDKKLGRYLKNLYKISEEKDGE